MKIKSILSVVLVSMFALSTAYAEKPVAISKADGPAAKAGIKKGDVIKSIKDNFKIDNDIIERMEERENQNRMLIKAMMDAQNQSQNG